MIAQFYNCYSDTRYINKQLENGLIVYNVIVKQPCNIINPLLVMKYDTDVLNRNYCYLPEFNRYYYVADKVVAKGKRIIVSLQVDVLMSYKNEILQSYQLITRNEGIGNPTYVVDSNYPIRQAGYNDVIKFSSSIFSSNVINETSFNYVINVAGGSKGESEKNEN